jgi:hypothetical protein
MQFDSDFQGGGMGIQRALIVQSGLTGSGIAQVFINDVGQEILDRAPKTEHILPLSVPVKRFRFERHIKTLSQRIITTLYYHPSK